MLQSAAVLLDPQSSWARATELKEVILARDASKVYQKTPEEILEALRIWLRPWHAFEGRKTRPLWTPSAVSVTYGAEAVECVSRLILWFKTNEIAPEILEAVRVVLIDALTSLTTFGPLASQGPDLLGPEWISGVNEVFAGSNKFPPPFRLIKDLLAESPNRKV